MSELFNELRRRNVVRVGLAYILVAWLLAQVAELALDSFEAPGWVIKAVLLLLALGLPVALFFAWAFELTPDGLKKEADVDRSQSITADTGRKLNSVIIAVLVIAVGMLLVDKFLPQPGLPQVEGAASAEGAVPAIEAEPVVDSNSIAVLPFVDMSPAKDQEYFTDGLTENLLHALAQIRELKVAGRTSSFAFKGLNTDLRDIGQQLNVSSILEGSVQKAGGRIRITTQLINAEDGYHLWSKTFDRDLTDIFKVQDEIAEAVANALRKSLLGGSTKTKIPTNNFEAYNDYLLGLSYLHVESMEAWRKANDQFQLAIEKDPDMALAWAGLARAINLETGFGSEFAVGFERARLAAQKAIELDPDLAEAHLAMAEIHVSYDWDWDSAEASLDRAFSLRPGDPDIVLEMANLMSIRGDLQGRKAAIEQALQQDPLNNAVNRRHVGVLARSGQLEEALTKGKFLAAASPDAGGIPYGIANILIRLENYEEALVWAEKESFNHLRLELEAILYKELDDAETAQLKLQELIDTWGDDVSAQVSSVYAAWGDVDETFAALERGLEVRDPGIVNIQAHDEMVALLKDDPRYEAFLRKLNLL